MRSTLHYLDRVSIIPSCMLFLPVQLLIEAFKPLSGGIEYESFCKTANFTTIFHFRDLNSKVLVKDSTSSAIKNAKSENRLPTCFKPLGRCGILIRQTEVRSYGGMQSWLKLYCQTCEAGFFRAPFDSPSWQTIKNASVKCCFGNSKVLSKLPKIWTVWMISMVVSQLEYLLIKLSQNSTDCFFNAMA